MRGCASLLAAAALALSAFSGRGTEVGGSARLSAMERAAQSMRVGYWPGSAGGYRKRPRGSHKQKRRVMMAKRSKGR